HCSDRIKLRVAADIDPETLQERDATKIIPPLLGAARRARSIVNSSSVARLQIANGTTQGRRHRS
ncbi:MAG: hypothetical protein AAGD23_11675, partial [Pseudomonadota bacterium]